MSNAIKTSIDASGRLVVPKAVRRYREGRVEIEPAPREVRIVRRSKICVAEPVEPSEKLTREVVRQTQQAIRSRSTEG